MKVSQTIDAKLRISQEKDEDERPTIETVPNIEATEAPGGELLVPEGNRLEFEDSIKTLIVSGKGAMKQENRDSIEFTTVEGERKPEDPGGTCADSDILDAKNAGVDLEPEDPGGTFVDSERRNV